MRNDLLELTVGYSCNSNCRFCSIDPRKRGINSTTTELIAKIREAKQNGFRILGFGGGDPTIRKDIFLLAQAGKMVGFEAVRIQTNGIALAYYDFCKKLVEAGVNIFKISVHSHKPDISDYLTRVPKSLECVLQGIGNLQKLGVRIELSIVLTKQNYRFLPQYIDFFIQKGIGSFCIIFPIYSGNMLLCKDDVGVKVSEAAPYIHEALDLIKAFELDKGIVFNMPFCYMIGYENDVVELAAFNTRVETPDFIIEDLDVDRKMGKIKFVSCQSCKYFQKCEGVWKSYVDIYGNEEFKPII